jgi:hypothetical protein
MFAFVELIGTGDVGVILKGIWHDGALYVPRSQRKIPSGY